MGLKDRIMRKVADISNRRMEKFGNQILAEVKEAGYKYYPGSTKVIPSFRILGKEEGEVGGTFGFIVKVHVGSTLREAYWAVYGNGGKGAIIYPTHTRSTGNKVPMLGEYPGGIPGYGWKPYVHGYEGHNFLREVASRH